MGRDLKDHSDGQVSGAPAQAEWVTPDISFHDISQFTENTAADANSDGLLTKGS